MKMEALKRQGRRTDLEELTSSPLATKLEEDNLTSCPMGTKLEITSLPLERKLKEDNLTLCQLGTKLNSAEEISRDAKESVRQIFRYIRLTELIPELLEMVDNKRIAFSPAVELSYLTEDEQYTLLDVMQCAMATPNLAQAIHLKKLSQAGEFTPEKMEEIIFQQKPNQKDKYNITYDRFTKYIPRNVVTPKEVENHLLKCVIACDRYGINLDDIQIDSEVIKPKKVERER